MGKDAVKSKSGNGRSGSSNKTTPTKSSRGSPLKNRKAKSDVKCQKDAPGWYLSSELFDGNIEGIQVTHSDRKNDAHIQPLVEAINDPESNGDLESIGLIDGFRMRISLRNSNALLNTRNCYQRKMIIAVKDEDETSADSRLESLRTIKKFLEKPENNRFGTKVYIKQPGWDLTPPDPLPLRKVDNVLQYGEIVRLINGLFDNVDSSWAENNVDTAKVFFTEGNIPYAATTDLGFPFDAVQVDDSPIVTNDSANNGTSG